MLVDQSVLQPFFEVEVTLLNELIALRLEDGTWGLFTLYELGEI
jgi:hypothetical protein